MDAVVRSSDSLPPGQSEFGHTGTTEAPSSWRPAQAVERPSAAVMN